MTQRSNPAKAVPQLSDPAIYGAGVPHEEFARLRRECPVSLVREVPRLLHSLGQRASAASGSYWAVTTHRSITDASRQPEIFSSAALGAFLADPKSPQELERNRQILINMDAPQHNRIRALVSGAFGPTAIRHLAGNVRMHARRIVERAVKAERFDVVADLAAELPLLVLADLLGMPHEDRRLMFRWSNDIVGFDDPEFGGGDVARYQRAFADAFLYARDIASEKRRNPGDDLVSALVRAELDGHRLSDSEFGHLWILLVIGGNESTRHLISGSLAALTEWPGERKRLQEDAGLIPTAVEEFLRWVSPIMQFRRTAVRDVELEGQQIRAGEKVVLYYVSANRDESVFPDAGRLNLGRAPNPHLAFGIGPHFCLGAHLARIEAGTLLEELRPHLSGFECLAAPVRLESNFMNGIKSLPARLNGPQHE